MTGHGALGRIIPGSLSVGQPTHLEWRIFPHPSSTTKFFRCIFMQIVVPYINIALSLFFIAKQGLL